MEFENAPPKSHLIWFFVGMTALWFVWFFTGGPERATTTNTGVFLKPLAPLDTGKSYGIVTDIFKKDTYKRDNSKW